MQQKKLPGKAIAHEILGANKNQLKAHGNCEKLMRNWKAHRRLWGAHGRHRSSREKLTGTRWTWGLPRGRHSRCRARLSTLAIGTRRMWADVWVAWSPLNPSDAPLRRFPPWAEASPHCCSPPPTGNGSVTVSLTNGLLYKLQKVYCIYHLRCFVTTKKLRKGLLTISI